MAEVQRTNENHEKAWIRAQEERIVKLEEYQQKRDIAELVKAYVKEVLRGVIIVRNPMDLILETAELVASVSSGILGFIGIDIDELVDLGDVSADFEMEDGQHQTRSGDKSEEKTGQDFRAVYNASIKELMDGIWNL